MLRLLLLLLISCNVWAATWLGRNKDYFGNIADRPYTDIGAHQYSVDTRTTIETRN